MNPGPGVKAPARVQEEVPTRLEPDYIHAEVPEPHRTRRRQILASHPEVQSLAGPARYSVLFIVALVTVQIAAAVALRHAPWWLLLIGAYGLGAIVNHGLLVLIHECTHNLVWKGTRGNRILAILANVPIIFPAAMSFRTFHLLHHKYQGDLEYDADLPGPTEARVVGNSSLRKTIWLLFFFAVEGIVRPFRLKKNIKLFEGWTIINTVAMVAVATAVVWFAGWEALLYLVLSTIFSVGLHPVGARWIQEHFVMRVGQETYSYYGPWNRVAFNVGYHNEHHDLMTVPWSKLPRIRAIAPEFYEDLYAHRSWTKLLFRFLFDPELTLHSRVVRASADATTEKPRASSPASAAVGVGDPLTSAAAAGTAE
jgi:sphingolipid delta-4 desaturase